MSLPHSSPNPKTSAREYAIQFLYQCESERLFHYSENHFASFAQHQRLPGELVPLVRELARGTLDHVHQIDERIQEASTNWKMSRMSVVDRSILRLAAYELTSTDTPPKVVMNEAIELAKKFGAADSGRFVNGILDRLGAAGADPFPGVFPEA